MAKKKRKLSAYNLHVKREMKAGKSMKAAARSWRGGKSKPRKRAAPKAKRRSIRSRVTGGRKVAKGGFNTQKLYKLVRMAALVAPGAVIAMGPGDIKSKGRRLLLDYTGVDINSGQFYGDALARGWLPFVMANVVTYGIPKINSLLKGVV